MRCLFAVIIIPVCNLVLSSSATSPPAVFATCTYSSFLFVCFLHDVKNVLKMYRLSSGEELRTFPLDVGSVVGFTGRKRDSEIFYYFTSFLSPGMFTTKFTVKISLKNLDAKCPKNVRKQGKMRKLVSLGLIKWC